MVHRALQVVLLVGATTGRVVKLESLLVFSGENQDPPKCIYSHDRPPTGLPRIMYPLYYDLPQYNNVTGVCTDEYLKNLSKGCKSILAVVNPGNGPAAVGSEGYNGYQACTRMMDKNGVQMIGYIKTKVAHVLPSGIWKYTGVRNISDIKRDVDSWYKHFGHIPNFKGIFVDETSDYAQIYDNAFGINNIAFYREVITYIKTKWKNSLVVLNPGSFTSTELLTAAPGFPEPADISIPYEDYSYHWRPKNNNCTLVQRNPDMGNFGIGPWCKFVPLWDHVEKFKNGVSDHKYIAAAFLHSNKWGIEFAKHAARRAALWNFTYFYSTNLLLANNPWRYLPEYWEEYLEFLHEYAFVKVKGIVDIPPVPLKATDSGYIPVPGYNPDPTYVDGYNKFSCPYNWKNNAHPHFPDMFNCRKYFTCYDDWKFHHLACEEHMNFDPVLGKCVSESVNPCIQKSTASDSPFVCPEHWKADPNNNYADTQNCTLFYTCSDKGIEHNICEGNWRFNPETRYCVPKDQTPCIQYPKKLSPVPAMKPIVMDMIEQDVELMAEIPEFASPVPAVLPFTCPYNWEQDSNKFYADMYNCSMFYTCGKKITHTYCAGGERFDPILRYCGPMEKVPCVEAARDLSGAVPEKVKFSCPFNWKKDPNKFYVDIYDCTRFYTCGKKITLTYCTGDQRFNPITRYCAPKDKVPCAVVVKEAHKIVTPTTTRLPIRTSTKRMPLSTTANPISVPIVTTLLPIRTTTKRLPIPTTANPIPLPITTLLPIRTTTTRMPAPTTANLIPLAITTRLPIRTTTKRISASTTANPIPLLTTTRLPIHTTTKRRVPIRTITTKRMPVPTTANPIPVPTTTKHVPAPAATKDMPFVCPPNWEKDANKYYIDVFDCRMFYECGRKIMRNACNGNQRFNPITRFCVAPEQVPCYQAL